MKLVQLSDCHLFAEPQTLGYGSINPAQSLTAILRQVAEEKPDAVLISGDISGDDSAASYALFLHLIRTHLPALPWRVIAGNHDNNPAFDSVMRDHLLMAGSPWQLGPLWIHGIDTRYERGLGQVRAAEKAAVLNARQCDTEHLHIIALHHHPVASDSWMDKYCLVNPEEVSDLLTQGDFALVVHGHTHADITSRLAQTPVLGVPSTCWQWQLTADFKLDPSGPGYRVIVYRDQQLTTYVRRLT